MKNNNNNLKVVCGTLAGFMLGGLSIVGANQAIQAIQNTEIKVSLNGQVQEFKDEATGEAQYPITYHDRTYLPLRNVASLSGLTVDYDTTTNTAVLNSDYGVYDNTVGIFFKNFYIQQWSQLAGVEVYCFRGNNLWLLSTTLEDLEVYDSSFGPGHSSELYETNLGSIEGIHPLFVQNGDDDPGNYYLDSIIIKFDNGGYGILKDDEISAISANEIKDLLKK